MAVSRFWVKALLRDLLIGLRVLVEVVVRVLVGPDGLTAALGLGALRFGDIHPQYPPVKLAVVHVLDRGLGVLTLLEGHEAKASVFFWGGQGRGETATSGRGSALGRRVLTCRLLDGDVDVDDVAKRNKCRMNNGFIYVLL